MKQDKKPEEKKHDAPQNTVQQKDEHQKEVEELLRQLDEAKDKERRALADYHNLQRRTQEDRLKMVKLAAGSVMESILQPLEHLFLAKEHLQDSGLQMVYQQFQDALRGEGLEEIDALGKEFDPQTMEVVEKQAVDDHKQVGKVVKVTSRGYRLNGEVIRHAKVIVGEAK